jgi:hypothetical protein
MRSPSATRPFVLLVLLAGCGGVQMIGNEDPRTAAGARPNVTEATPEAQARTTGELEDDEQVVEPEHPYVDTPHERTMVHVHTPRGVCSGTVVGKRLVATAHQCLPADLQTGAPIKAQDAEKWRVEVASSTMTWTARGVKTAAVPACDWHGLDLAVLVLDDDVPTLVEPAKLSSAPGPGGEVQALGFGTCAGETRGFSGRMGPLVTRRDDAVVVQIPLCRGDVGGGIFDTGGGYLGVVSHHGEAGPTARGLTTVFRIDTAKVRNLVAQGQALAAGQKVQPVRCD